MTKPNTIPNHATIELHTRNWLHDIVLGLNLCPFAHRPARQQQICFQVSNSDTEQCLLGELIQAIQQLEKKPVEECETTLFIVPQLLADFYDYQFFLDEANRHIKRHHWQGIFQLASFHPRYCFAGSDNQDPANLTNRSPYPIVHILRESSLSAALEHMAKPEEIPNDNINTMTTLSEQKKQQLFSYLYR